MAKATETGTSRTGLDLSKEKIIQFSLVVKDAEKVAKRFSRIFGIHWKLYELNLEQYILHDKEPADSGCRMKLAIGCFGGRSLKLIQPVSGQSAYAEFLENSGGGFYTIGLGTLINHGHIVNALQSEGISLEMQGNIDGAPFSIMDTADDLGCRIEFSGSTRDMEETNIRQTGILMPDGQGIADLEKPAFQAGRRLTRSVLS